MKISSVELFDVKVTRSAMWNPIVIRINTDEGLSGLGEVGLGIGLGRVR